MCRRPNFHVQTQHHNIWPGEDNVGVVEQCVRLSAGVSARCCAVCCLIKFGNYKIIPST